MESDEWVNAEELLGRKPTLEDVKGLMRNYEVVFNVLDDVFYVKPRNIHGVKAGDGKGLNGVKLKDFLSRFNDLTPKPVFLDELCVEFRNCERIYDELLKSGVIEEIVVFGMTFVKVKR